MTSDEKQLRRLVKLEAHINETKLLIDEQRGRVTSGHAIDPSRSQDLLTALEESLRTLLNFRRVALLGNANKM